MKEFRNAIILTYGIVISITIAAIVLIGDYSVFNIVKTLINGIAPTTITFVGAFMLKNMIAYNGKNTRGNDVFEFISTISFSLVIVYSIFYIVFLGANSKKIKYIFSILLIIITVILLLYARKFSKLEYGKTKNVSKISG